MNLHPIKVYCAIAILFMAPLVIFMMKKLMPDAGFLEAVAVWIMMVALANKLGK